MLSAIFAFIESVPALEKFFETLLSAWMIRKQQQEAALIALAAKDAAESKTDDDLKKAAEEAANATRNL